MALALNSSHPLAAKVAALIAVDPSSNSLKDLKRAGVTFTPDAGVAFVTNPTYGAAVRTTGNSGGTHAGFSISPGLSQASNVAGFKSTLFLVMAKLAEIAEDLTTYKNCSLLGQNAYIYQAVPVITSSANGRKVALSTNTQDVYNAGRTSNISIYGDGLRHTIATTSANATGGNAVAGKLYVDGANTGIAFTGGEGGDATISAINQLANSSTGYDFMYLVIFNDVLTDAEIADLHASVGDYNVFGLVTGAGPVAAVPAGTVTVGTVTPASNTASVQFTYSGSDSTGYEYRLNGGAAVTVTGGASPISLTGLTAGTAYTVEVRATNATGAGAWSASKSFTTAAAAPAGTVTIGTVTVTSGGASVPFTYSGSDATGYDYRINGGTVVDGGTTSPISVSGLTASTNYTVEVRAKNAGGTGAWSASKSFTTSTSSDVTAPTLSGTVTSSSITSSSYTVSWPAGTDNVAVTGYEYRLNGGSWVSVGNVLTTNITGRTPSSTDTFEVRAYDAAGNRSSAMSKSVTLLASVTASLVITEPLTIAGLPAAGLTGISAVVVQSSDLTYVCKLSGLTTDSSGRIQGLTHASMVVGTKYDVYFKHLANKNRGHKVEVTAS